MLNTRFLIAIFTLGILGCGTPSVATLGGTAPDVDPLREPLPGIYTLRSAAAGMSVEVYNQDPDNGAPIQQWTYWGGPNQQWSLVAVRGAYQLINMNSKRCLEVKDADDSDGATIQQWDCWGGDNQRWTFGEAAATHRTLVNVATQKCLDVAKNSSVSGAPLQQWACGGETSQQWDLTPLTETARNTTAPTPSPTATPIATAGPVLPTAAQDQLIREYMKKVLDTPHNYPGGGLRGSPGSYAAIGETNIKEFVASITDSAHRYLPSSLAFNERAALLIADINAESSFQVNTSAPNGAGFSVGVQQVTGFIWVPAFAQNASGLGLFHYNDAGWNPADTTNNDVASSIWDNMHVANWAISTQAKNGGQDTAAGPNGPMPRTWWTGLYCWVSGYPAAQRGGDTVQSTNYRKEQQADLALLGLDPALLDRSF